jgi:DEAD/DEAH box helicase domain-containing protein
MCDRHDLGVALGDNGQGEARIERGLLRLGAGKAGRRDEPPPGDDYEPNVFVYDAYPGGIGLSEPLYRLHDRLLAESRRLIAACACADGCPSCVGPARRKWRQEQRVALSFLDTVIRNDLGAQPEGLDILRRDAAKKGPGNRPTGANGPNRGSSAAEIPG